MKSKRHAPRKKLPMFRLKPIPAFDARKGYKRCELVGVGSDVVNGFKPDSDFWHDRTGQIVVRFSCQGYFLHFGAMTSKGEKLTTVSWEFADFIMETLFDWALEGIDDLPNSVYENLSVDTPIGRSLKAARRP